MSSKRRVRPGHREQHLGSREGWLRAAVLGADDGIVSTASLMIGVAAASASKGTILISGIAGLIAGAMSMAAGEYVSVSSQRDAEDATIAVEKEELATDARAELLELAMIYEKRGLDPDLAKKVADQLTAHNQLEAHLRDELGMSEATRARPLQAAVVSAMSFATLAILPIFAHIFSPAQFRIPVIAVVALASLAFLGAVGGRLAGAPQLRAAFRVLVGGGLAMAVSAIAGRLLGGIS